MSIHNDVHQMIKAFEDFRKNAENLDRDMRAFLQPQLDALNERISLTQQVAQQKIDALVDTISTLTDRVEALEHELESGRVDHDRNG